MGEIGEEGVEMERGWEIDGGGGEGEEEWGRKGWMGWIGGGMVRGGNGEGRYREEGG